MKIILPAYLGPQDIPRTSSSNFPRTSPKYPFWPFWGCPNLTFWGRPNLTFWGRPEKISRGRSNLMFNERPWDVDSGPPQNVLKTSPRRSTEYSNFFNFSFRIYSIDQIYLRAFQHSNCIENPVKLLIWSIFCKISYLIFSINFFCERSSSQKLDWVLNIPLILSSNVICHAYSMPNQDFQAWCISHMSFKCWGEMDWQKIIIQKDIIHYFKYREFSGVFTINDQFW